MVTTSKMSRNYSELFSKNEAAMLQDADNAITECNLWDWMNVYDPPNGFGLDNHPNLTRINNAMKYGGHSGASYGWTMRQMEYIAKHGWTLYEFKIRQQKRKEEEDLNRKRDKEVVNVMVQASETAAGLIAKAFRDNNGVVNPLTIAEASRGVSGFEGQADAMKKFSEGHMSYAEMRSLCG